MPVSSIRLNDYLHHAVKYSEWSLSQLAREGVERGLINGMMGVCYQCGSGLMELEEKKSGRHPRSDHPVQVCSRCLEKFETEDSDQIEEPYLHRAYDSDNLYDVDTSDLPEIGISYAVDSRAVRMARCYHAGEDTDGTYWAGKSRHEGIVQEHRIPLIEIALRSNALSLATQEATFPVFQNALMEAWNYATLIIPMMNHPPGLDISRDKFEELMSTDLDSLAESELQIHQDEFADFVEPYFSYLDPECYCPACGVATGDGYEECMVCFHRWEDCPSCSESEDSSGQIVHYIDTSGEPSDEWLWTNCWECGNYKNIIYDEEKKEIFKQRYRRVFSEIKDEHVAIHPKLIPE